MIYLYECEFHGEMEIEHKLEETAELCPTCLVEGVSTKIKRLIAGATNFILVGGGWASSGYK